MTTNGTRSYIWSVVLVKVDQNIVNETSRGGCENARGREQEAGYSCALIPEGLKVRSLAIQKLSLRRITERSCL